ncbi:hypothetical protein JOE11_002340 [Robbsia andropogonis]|uniref:hypothetical protein n=1 Tax=Robbsia andropogonis TaxID=28092 RepID=UPI0020A026AD|nr:hypothetical protein [Robbsia andropogonis]MCP1117695.1 hypothetical protein [Robbsia andropogonis]MCP1127161.1 hypothetical protein [Robbsia andropogonis]
MRDLLLNGLLAICLIALACLFVAIFNARIGQLEWWIGDEKAENRPGRRLAFIRSSWFFYGAGVTFVTAALALVFLIN